MLNEAHATMKAARPGSEWVRKSRRTFSVNVPDQSPRAIAVASAAVKAAVRAAHVRVYQFT